MKVSDTQQIERIREALKAFPRPAKWSGRWNAGVRCYEVCSDAGPVARLVRCFDEANYARFIAACNPEAISALLARLEECERDARRWRKLNDEASKKDSGIAVCMFSFKREQFYEIENPAQLLDCLIKDESLASLSEQASKGTT